MTSRDFQIHPLPAEWQLTPLGKDGNLKKSKAPYAKEWQKTDISRAEIESAIASGKATGYGLRLGAPSGYVVAIDFDGQSAIDMGLTLFGELPNTVSWTSGRLGRYQAVFKVPADYCELVSNTVVKTGVIGADGKAEQIEFRYTGNQSALPPSAHPDTDGYVWINSHDYTPVADLPKVVIDFWLERLAPKVTTKTSVKTKPKPKTETKTEPKLDTEAYTAIPIPLKNCISNQNLELMSGAIDGGRNAAGVRLSKDLIGAANYLEAKGIDFEGDPRGLFDEFCQNCTPPIGEGKDDSPDEPDKIWDWAERDNPQPSRNRFGDDGLDNIIEAWELKNDPSDKSQRCPYFTSSPAKGLYRVGLKRDEETGEFVKKRERIGRHLDCIAYANNPEGNGSSLQLEFDTIRGHLSRCTMPRGYIVSETAMMLAELVNRGYQFNVEKKKLLIQYLNGLGENIDLTFTITDSTGWIGERYVSQHKTYGGGDLKFGGIETSDETATEIKGDLQTWKQHIGSKMPGNSRLIFGGGTAFAAVLLPIVKLESGGFHFTGGTSEGKTTILKVAASIVGEKRIPHWRSTINALESTAKSRNHSLLTLDEIGQADPRHVGEIAYMLANGQGKARMTKQLSSRKPASWDLLFLSSGELGMGEYMALAGVKQKGGQEVRMPDIPAVPFGSPFGVFENIHSCDSSKEFAQNLESATNRYRGAAIDVFLDKLVIDRVDEKFDGAMALSTEQCRM